MVKVTVPCRRYYCDEMPEGDFLKFVENLHRFTDIKIQYYNVLYDSKYKKEQAEVRLQGGNMTSWCKKTFGIGDYYVAAINQTAAGQLSSQKERIKLYINDRLSEIAEIEDKMADLREQLDKKYKVKAAILSYYKTGKFEKPYSKCSIRVKNGLLSGYKIDVQPVEEYERKVETHIRRFKHRMKMLQFRLKRKQEKLNHLKNDIPERIIFGSKAAYSQKDNPDNENWQEEFMDRRYSAILFPGRHTKKFLNCELNDGPFEDGGISFMGETLEDFLGEVDMSIDDSAEEINKALMECGILPVLEFEWNMAKKNYVREPKKLSKMIDTHLGDVYVGDICINIILRDYGEEEEDLAFSFDLYVYGENTGYGHKEDASGNIIPYDYAEGTDIFVLETPSDFEDFKTVAEILISEYIAGNDTRFGKQNPYSLVEKASKPLRKW